MSSCWSFVLLIHYHVLKVGMFYAANSSHSNCLTEFSAKKSSRSQSMTNKWDERLENSNTWSSMLLNKTVLDEYQKWLKLQKQLRWNSWRNSKLFSTNSILNSRRGAYENIAFFIHSITTKGRETAPSQPLLTCWPTFQLLEKLKSQMQQLSQTIVVLLLGRSPGISRGYFCTVQVCLRNAQFN